MVLIVVLIEVFVNA